MTSMAKQLKAILPPVVVGVALVLAWQLFVVVRHIKPFLLPPPSAIWHEIVGNRSKEDVNQGLSFHGCSPAAQCLLAQCPRSHQPG